MQPQSDGIDFTPVSNQPTGNTNQYDGLDFTPTMSPQQSATLSGHATGIMQNLLKGTASTMLPSSQNTFDQGVGGLKSIGDTVAGAARFGENVANQTAGRVVNAVQGNGFTPLSNDQLGNTMANPSSQVNQNVDSALAPSNDAQSLGKTMGNIGQALIPIGGEASAAKAAGETSLLQKAGSAISDVASKVADKTGLSGTMDSLNSWLRSKFSARTLQEVNATPATDVYKLNPVERKQYFDNQKLALDQQHSTVESTIAKKSADTQAALQTEAEGLTKQLATASRDETVALRPKIIQAMGKQSQQYRSLVDEAIAPYKDVGIHNRELGSFIDSKFAENPEMAQAMKTKLGIPELKPSADGLPVIEATAPDTTIGQIYDKTKSLGQDMGSAAKKGTRVYSADEKMTDDTIHTLTDFMKSKGVDLSKPRQFWAQYAPIRNQLVMEAKPFNQAGTQTKTFANTLTRVAQGKDINNENFISSVEKLLGEKVGGDTKAVVGKMAQNEKSQLATKLDAAAQKAENDLNHEKASMKLSETEFEAERKARVRKAIKVTLGALGGYEANKKIKQATGFGF